MIEVNQFCKQCGKMVYAYEGVRDFNGNAFCNVKCVIDYKEEEKARESITGKKRKTYPADIRQ